MAWRISTLMSERQEFIHFALQDNANISELCRRFGISRKTGYKFMKRYKSGGFSALVDQPRRPLKNPYKTNPKIEEKIVSLRDQHPAWGARKLKRRLENLGHEHLPAISTITQILKRHNRIRKDESKKHTPWQRFEAEHPNDLWQMDFKGHFALQQERCHPLTILDDHSRYSLGIRACTNEQKETVKQQLINIFRIFGLPSAILMDNGSPWGNHSDYGHTQLTAWMMRLGIQIRHSRPLHPQTMGKDERFHRTMAAEIIPECVGKTIPYCQQAFDRWRIIYNTERPHEALDMQTPSQFYQISQRTYPEKLPEIEYNPSDQIRKVDTNGRVQFKNKRFRIGRAFSGQFVAIRPTKNEGRFDIYFQHQRVVEIDWINYIRHKI